MGSEKLYEVKFKHCVFTLYDTIEEFEDYFDLLKFLHIAQKGEVLTILLNSPGGRCDIGDTIIKAMESSEASIHCVVEAPCYSMASLIALSGDKLTFERNTYLMFHHYSTMYYGKGAEIELQHKNEYANINKQFKDVCMPFLTERECNKVINGEDLYINSDDDSTVKRIKRHFK